MTPHLLSPKDIRPGDTLLRQDGGVLCGHRVTEVIGYPDTDVGWYNITLDDYTHVMLGDEQNVAVLR